MTSSRVVAAAAAVLALALVGGGAYVLLDDDPAAPPKASPGHGTPIPGARIGGTKPGSLVSATTLPYVPESKDLPRSARVVYRSTEGDTGTSTVVSGSVFVPRTQPPPGGFPVMALGHASLGIDVPCGPSLSADLAGMKKSVAVFTNLGFAVTIADYQGLGQEGVHPYLDSRTAGYNIIDSVRALRATFPDVSIATLWGAFGGSQGGGAVWAADELAADYAPELDLVGATVVSPAADAVGLVDLAVEGALTQDQRATFQQLIESLARLHPDLDRDDYRSGYAKENWDVLTACSGRTIADRGKAIASIGRFDLAPRTPAAAQRMRELLQAWALPEGPLSAPLAVAYGGKDTFIDPEWTSAALLRQCAQGGQVARRFYPDKGHGDIDFINEGSWLLTRFQGAPAVDDCPAR